jgi:hypothetical protein
MLIEYRRCRGLAERHTAFVFTLVKPWFAQIEDREHSWLGQRGIGGAR